MTSNNSFAACPGCGTKDIKNIRPKLCYPCFVNPNITISFYHAKQKYLLEDDDINKSHIYYSYYNTEYGKSTKYILIDIHSLAYHLTRNLDCNHEKRLAFEKQSRRRIFKDIPIRNIITPQTRQHMNNLLKEYLTRYNIVLNNDIQKYIDYLIDKHHSNDNNSETATAIIIIDKLLEAINNKQICNNIDSYSQELRAKRKEELNNRLKHDQGLSKHAQGLGVYYNYINYGRYDIEYIMNYLQKNYERFGPKRFTRSNGQDDDDGYWFV